MRKKILLTLISFLTCLCTPAFAQELVVRSDTTLFYTQISPGVYTFGVNDKTYDSLVGLGEVIYERFKRGEGFSFDEHSENLIEQALLTGEPILLQDLTKGLSQLTGEAFTMEEAYMVVGILNLAKANGFNPFQEISFNNFFKAQDAGRLDVRKVVKVFVGLSGIVDGLQGLGVENAPRIEALAASNPIIKDLVIQKFSLEQGPSTKITQTKLQVINRQIIASFFETAEGSKVRNSPQNQENLKNGLKTIEDLLGLFHSKTTNILAAADALTLYLADASKTDLKDLPEAQMPDTHTTGCLLAPSLNTTGVLNNRISVVNPLGVASGEEIETYGMWLKGTASTGTQQPFKKEPGFKFNQQGVMFGVDTGDRIDGESMIGMAGSFLKNTVTNKTSSLAKDDIDTYTGSLYGLFSIDTKWFLSGQMSYGHSSIKKNRATGDLANNKATAKTKGTTFNGRVRGGYVWWLNEDIQLVSTLGLGRTAINIKGYKESGAGLNRKVDARKLSRTVGILGISGRYTTQIGEMKVKPELHVNMDYALDGKNPDTKIHLAEVIDISTPAEKISKSFYNFGGSVKFVVSKMIDITTCYDAGLSTKFISHTGAMKLRINL